MLYPPLLEWSPVRVDSQTSDDRSVSLVRVLAALNVLAVLCACSSSSSKHGGPAARDAGDRKRDAATDAVPIDAATFADAAASDGSAPGDAAAPIDDGPGRTVTIRFRAALGDEDFDCNKNYRLPKYGWVEPREFKFYVNDLSLIDRQGHETPVRILHRPPGQSGEVALLAFDTESCGGGFAGPFTTVIGKVPEGDYRGIVFSNGVPEQLNHADPLTLKDPLRVATMYWDWFQGFKFMAAEFGRAYDVSDGDEDAGVAPSQSILHLGSVGCSGDASQNVTCEIPNRNHIRLPDFDPDANVIVADIAGVFVVDDPKTQSFCHGGRASCAQVYRNVGIDLATGKAIDTQRVFRVE